MRVGHGYALATLSLQLSRRRRKGRKTLPPMIATTLFWQTSLHNLVDGAAKCTQVFNSSC
jgi:hypothetical protein